MKPLLKWAGGKRHIAKELQTFFPSDWNEGTYIEPFIGGGAMFLHLNPKNAVIADLNSRLVSFYNHIKDNPDSVFDGISEIAENFNKLSQEDKESYFYEVRTIYNASKFNSMESAILLYAINKLCFNGLYRENSKGGFNVPFGHKKIFPSLDKIEFIQVSELLKHTVILNADFMETISRAKPSDFIYLDPPYIPIDVTASFTSYQAEGFGIHEQEKLASIMMELKNSGIKAMCSNSDTKVAREVFGKLNLGTIQAPRMVSAKASGRGSISELVITNY